VNNGPACVCAGGHILYPNCRDTYGVTTNRDRYYLGPREEVTASTGAWQRIGSHFDQCLSGPCTPGVDDADDFRDHFGDSPAGFYHDDFEHRLTVEEAELSVAGSRYFVDGWYLIGDDVDLFNSMARREVNPTLLMNVWTFPFLAPIANGSVLDEIPGANLELKDTGEGRLQIAASTTDLGGGMHHYEYALMNFDFDRQVDRFEVPIAPGAVVTNVRSRGLGDDPVNEWTATIGAAEVVWEAPPGTGLDWAMLVSFGFDADAPPVASEARLSVRETGSPSTLRFSVAPEPSAVALAAASVLVLAGVRPKREHV
jgi:hypothetical protein